MKAGAVLALVVAAALPACATVLHHHQPASVLHCDNGETVDVGYSGDLAIVTYKNRRHRMRTAISGSGARYVGDGLEWWSKGFEEGTIALLPPGEQVSTGERIACRAGPPP